MESLLVGTVFDKSANSGEVDTPVEKWEEDFMNDSEDDPREYDDSADEYETEPYYSDEYHYPSEWGSDF